LFNMAEITIPRTGAHLGLAGQVVNYRCADCRLSPKGNLIIVIRQTNRCGQFQRVRDGRSAKVAVKRNKVWTIIRRSSAQLAIW
jgi:hypothetical protein